jgi:LAS superfamily LD-carboxypeptidase LdcB
MPPYARLKQLSGQDDSAIDYQSLPVAVHNELVQPLLALQAKAVERGFEISVASAYRDFDRQLLIWNDKASGRRPVLDSHGQRLDLSVLTPWQQVQAILRWSALPGASRHHWGTDIDIYDRAAVADDYKLQLSTDEVQEGGPFAAMHDWLDGHLSSSVPQVFFRPYENDRGGVAPERWHLSYAPVACQYQAELSVAGLMAVIEDKPLALKDTVLAHLDEIYQRFILVPARCYPAQYGHLLMDLNQ